jgi:hypothetical protein
MPEVQAFRAPLTSSSAQFSKQATSHMAAPQQPLALFTPVLTPAAASKQAATKVYVQRRKKSPPFGGDFLL